MPNKIIYSLRVYLELQKLGFQPVSTMENPYKKGFLCWVFQKTPELEKALEAVMNV